MVWSSCFGLVLFVSFIHDSSQCSEYDFQCEDGECIDSGLWCDSHKDCSDGTDEKYCRKSSFFNKNPNNCPPTYFRCADGPCIPMVGKCDGYRHCSDNSDEKTCHDLDYSYNNTHSTSKPVISPENETLEETRSKTPITTETSIVTGIFTTQMFKDESPIYLSDSFDSIEHSIQLDFSNLQISDYSHQRENARDWLLSQRNSDFGWDAETPRAITALYLSDVHHSTKRNESDLLMVKQLEVQLSVDLARNETKVMDMANLALYINALLAGCKDPKNFHGENLVRTLRNRVNIAQNTGKFVNPSIYLTLCLNNASNYEDSRKLHEIFTSRNSDLSRIDIQALALLTSTCVYRNTNFLSASSYDIIKQQFIQKLNNSFPGNVYEASLIFQGLQESKMSLPGLLEFILRQQQDSGSFGDILATYLVLPVLAGRSLLHLSEHCSQRYITDPAPIEVLKNVKNRKIYVQYSLNYGDPPEITQSIQMKVADGINFLDVMRLAQEINPKYRFMLDSDREIPVVYSIGGIPNDAEKGTYWTLHVASNTNTAASNAGRLVPYSGNIKKLMTNAGDEFVFWFRTV